MHINDLHKKLKSATGMLKRMRDNIPEEHYKPLYYALFESHMTYCITVFGTVSKTCTEKLFKIQKHCIRISFGDIEKYLDKFRTSARIVVYNVYQVHVHGHLKHRDWELNSFAKNIPNHCLIN